MSLTRIGSIGINTGIAFAGVTTIVTLNTANDALSIGATVNVGSGITLGASGDIFATGVSTVTTLKVGSGVTVSSDGDVFATGISTFSEDIKVGSGVTISPDGDGFYTGVVTATTFSGALAASNLTGALPAVSGADLTGIVTSIAAGSNISISGETGRVTITGLANTANVTADSLVVSGFSTFQNVSIAGTLTYEDVTNIDSVGVITARKGIVSSGVVTATSFDGTLASSNLSGALPVFSLIQLLLQPLLSGGIITVVAPLIISHFGLISWTELCGFLTVSFMLIAVLVKEKL